MGVDQVLFRAEDFNVAAEILSSMAGLHGGITFVQEGQSYFYGVPQLVFTAFLLLVVWCVPSSMTIMRHYSPVLWDGSEHEEVESRIRWQPTLAWAIITGIMAAVSFISLNNPSDFLYFNF